MTHAPNWEALQICLERLRIDHTAGRLKQAESELLYLIDHLHHVKAQMHRTVEVEDERKEPR